MSLHTAIDYCILRRRISLSHLLDNSNSHCIRHYVITGVILINNIVTHIVLLHWCHAIINNRYLLSLPLADYWMIIIYWILNIEYLRWTIATLPHRLYWIRQIISSYCHFFHCWYITPLFAFMLPLMMLLSDAITIFSLLLLFFCLFRWCYADAADIWYWYYWYFPYYWSFSSSFADIGFSLHFHYWY